MSFSPVLVYRTWTRYYHIICRYLGRLLLDNDVSVWSVMRVNILEKSCSRFCKYMILIFWQLGATYLAKWLILPYGCFMPVFLDSIQELFFSKLIASRFISSTLIYLETFLSTSILSTLHMHPFHLMFLHLEVSWYFHPAFHKEPKLLLFLFILTRLPHILANLAFPKSAWHFSDCLLSW